MISLSSFADYRPALPARQQARGVSAAFRSRCLCETRRYTGVVLLHTPCAAALGHSLGARPPGTLGFTPTGSPNPIPPAPAASFFYKIFIFFSSLFCRFSPCLVLRSLLTGESSWLQLSDGEGQEAASRRAKTTGKQD